MVVEELQKHFITYYQNNEFPSFEFLTAETTDNRTGFTMPNYWWLASMPVGRQLLNKLADKDPAETLTLLHKVDLDAAPVSGPNQGKSAFCWLAITPEGKRLIKKCPAVLFSTTIDWEGNNILAIRQKWNVTSSDDRTFEKLFLLAGMPPTQGVLFRSSATFIRDSLFKLIDPCINSMWSHNYFYFFKAQSQLYSTLNYRIKIDHPDLDFLDEQFLKELVSHRAPLIAGIVQKERLRFLSQLCVCKWIEANECEFDYKLTVAGFPSAHQNQVMQYIEIVFNALNNHFSFQNQLPCDLDEFTRFTTIIVSAISSIKDAFLSAHNVNQAIHEVLLQINNPVSAKPVHEYSDNNLPLKKRRRV